jgi:hypothetical protein
LKEINLYTFFKSNWEFSIISIGITLLVLFSLDHIFFWDTVQLASKHATFFYENNLRLALLPNEIDSGHIPTFGYLLAVLWTIFGKTLWISHLMILPFGIGIAWQLNRLTKQFFDKNHQIWVLLIVLVDTTFLSQVSLVSPDIPLLFFFLLALNTILFNKPGLKAFAFIFLFLISLRGMILTVPLFVFDVIFFTNFSGNIKNKIIYLIKTGLPYIPAALVFLLFSWFHYQQKGWIGYHENSPWAIFFEKVGIQGNIKNVGILAWRLVDYGRISLWVLALLFFPILWKKRKVLSKKTIQLACLTLLILLFLSIPAILYVDLKGHRYFMPIYFSFSVFICFFLFYEIKNPVLHKIGVIVTLISLISGSFWVYPEKISQGWDSTLGHFPYFQLRENMIQFMDENKIDKSQVGFDFPGAYPQKYLNLSEDTWSFPEVDIKTQEYILYSNVVNEFTDSEIKELNNSWEIIHTEHSKTVNFKLYHKPH